MLVLHMALGAQKPVLLETVQLEYQDSTLSVSIVTLRQLDKKLLNYKPISAIKFYILSLIKTLLKLHAASEKVAIGDIGWHFKC
jgi:hypothetical protein